MKHTELPESPSLPTKTEKSNYLISSCSNIQVCFSQDGGLQSGIQKEEVEITANFHQKSIKRS